MYDVECRIMITFKNYLFVSSIPILSFFVFIDFTSIFINYSLSLFMELNSLSFMKPLSCKLVSQYSVSFASFSAMLNL